MNMIEVFREMHKYTLETGNECGASFDKDGRLIDSIVYGGKTTVSIPDSANTVSVVHTHPSNVTFSNLDLETDYSRNALWSGVILGNGEVHFADYSRCAANKSFLATIFGGELLDYFLECAMKLGHSFEEINANPEAREKVIRLTCEGKNIRFSKLLQL